MLFVTSYCLLYGFDSSIWCKFKGYSLITLTHIFIIQCNLYIFSLLLHILTYIKILCPIKHNLHLLKAQFCTNQLSIVRSKLKIKCQSHLSKKSHETQIESICIATLRNMNELNEHQPLNIPKIFNLQFHQTQNNTFIYMVSTSIEDTIQ